MAGGSGVPASWLARAHEPHWQAASQAKGHLAAGYSLALQRAPPSPTAPAGGSPSARQRARGLLNPTVPMGIMGTPWNAMQGQQS